MTAVVKVWDMQKGGGCSSEPSWWDSVLTHSCSPRACASRICHPEIPPAMKQAHSSSPCSVLGNAQSSSWLTDTGLQHRNEPLPVLCSDLQGNIKPGSWCEPRPGWASQAQQTKLWVSRACPFTSPSRKGVFPPKWRVLLTSNWK